MSFFVGSYLVSFLGIMMYYSEKSYIGVSENMGELDTFLASLFSPCAKG